MTERVKLGGNSADYKLMFLGDVSGAQAIADGETLVWNEAQERFIPGQAGGGELGYKVYAALLTQNGPESEPSAVVMENTFGGTPTWSWAGVGTYDLTLAGAFSESTSVLFSFRSDGEYSVHVNFPTDNNTIRIETFEVATGNHIDGVLGSFPFEVRTYDPV